jgi:predicted phosphate transport protein (TIGR00153 family)
MVILKKEKEVIELIGKHTDKMKECLSSAIKTSEAYLESNVDEAKILGQETDKLEFEADLIRFEIRDILYSGAYMPLIRADIYQLIESIDMVANAAEKCCDCFLNQRPVIPDFLIPDYLEIVKESLGVGVPLKHAVLCYLEGICPIEVARQHSKQIGILEATVDKMEWDITMKIFSSELDYSHKLHLRICLDKIVKVSDLAEDAADRLELVTLKSIF